MSKCRTGNTPTPYFLLLFLISLFPYSLKSQTLLNQRPNIILIMVDDMGWSDLGCYGGEVMTPNLNRLAREGMRFTQFYNNAKCTTTRASLMTGLYPRRDKKDAELLRPSMLTVAELLKLGGYNTILSGKWHLGRDSTKHPVHRGFDHYYGLLDGCCNFFDPSTQDPEYKGSRIRYFAKGLERITEFPEAYYTTDAFTDYAIETLHELQDSKDPFFLHLTYTAPHYPIHAKPEDIAKYRGKFTMGWEEMRKQRYQRQAEMGLIDPQTYPLSEGDDRSYAWEDADQDFEDLRMAVYAGMIDCVDQNIGKLRETLEELGKLDNTLIMFLSDNGGCAEEPGGRNPKERTPGPKEDYVAVGPSWGWAQNAPFRRYKVWMHEGGINTPFIAWWPGRIPGDTICREVGHIIDVLPTFGELAGITPPDSFEKNLLLPIEGKSLVPILEGKHRKGHENLFWEYTGNRAIRTGDWKLVWDKRVQEWELYNLSKDQTETLNMASKLPQKKEEMAAEWFDWARYTGLKTK
ncbi:MAG: arylsulfatase [Bacteroidota bacterium]